jgi:hypothetical protein
MLLKAEAEHAMAAHGSARYHQVSNTPRAVGDENLKNVFAIGISAEEEGAWGPAVVELRGVLKSAAEVSRVPAFSVFVQM